MELKSNYKKEALKYSTNMTKTIEINAIDIRSEGTNKYPNVFLTYKAVDASHSDKLKSVIDVQGCTALAKDSESKLLIRGIYNDVEHEDYYGKVLQKRTYEASGGEIVDLWVEGETLMAKSRVGVEHVIADRAGNVRGSTYASAWLAYAQSQVNSNGGNTRDYIPNHIFTEFFEGKTVFPIKNVSVEMKYDHYVTENTTDLNGLMTIRKFDLMRISFLLFSTPGQTHSGIESFEIRKFNNTMKNNQSIRCLCDLDKLRTGDYLKNSKTNQIWSVTEEGDNLITTDIASGEVVTTNLEELKANEDLDLATVAEVLEEVKEKVESLELSDSTIDEVRSMIRACMSCQARMSDKIEKAKIEKKPKVRADDLIQSPDSIDNSSTDISVLSERVATLEEAVTSISKTLESINSKLDGMSTRSIESDTESPAEADVTAPESDEPSSDPIIAPDDSALADEDKKEDEIRSQMRSLSDLKSMSVKTSPVTNLNAGFKSYSTLIKKN
jgi:hypothetical protein